MKKIKALLKTVLTVVLAIPGPTHILGFAIALCVLFWLFKTNRMMPSFLWGMLPHTEPPRPSLWQRLLNFFSFSR